MPDIQIKNSRHIEIRGVTVIHGLALRVKSIGQHHQGNRPPVPYAVLEIGEPVEVEPEAAQAVTGSGERIAAKYDGHDVFDDVMRADEDLPTAAHSEETEGT